MKTSSKIIVIILIFLISVFAPPIIMGENYNGRIPTFVIIGALAAMTAVWKYKPTDVKEEKSSDKQQLDKNS